MDYEIDDRVIILSLNWLKGDWFEFGTVVGHSYPNAVVVHGDESDDVIDFDIFLGQELGSISPRILLPETADLAECLRPSLFHRIFKR